MHAETILASNLEWMRKSASVRDRPQVEKRMKDERRERRRRSRRREKKELKKRE